MMVGALTRCSWMAGEWPDDAKEVMPGGEGSDGGWLRELGLTAKEVGAFGKGVMTGDEGLATCGEGGNGRRQGGGA